MIARYNAALAWESEQDRSAGQLLAILAFLASTTGDAEQCRRCADEARAISGPVEGGQEATVYVRRGRDLLRITAIGTGTPMADIAKLVG